MKELNLSINNNENLKLEINNTNATVQFLNIKKGKCVRL